MSKSEQKEIRLEIQLPKDGFPKTMYFNRFRVERDEGYCLIQFGLMSAAGILLDQYSCVLPQRSLDQNQKSLLDYLARIGQPKQKNPLPWQGAPPGPGQKTDVADIIIMAIQSDMAETCFCVFPTTTVTRQKPFSTQQSFTAQPLVLLRSSVEVQKQLIVALYE
ncbi:hypothetical protein NXS98_14150 [Fontisphaera persica]|uniref:hypothetical protein n=1 Tax=Fontisphaera persica TaxID=2974023 RepID=UPI0024C0E274|nr:hypothetical protein [Fontisphaera persica]WCJ58850.1 hypothetical protein NXS98_14150 [Fontisphaera persica]